MYCVLYKSDIFIFTQDKESVLKKKNSDLYIIGISIKARELCKV